MTHRNRRPRAAPGRNVSAESCGLRLWGQVRLHERWDVRELPRLPAGRGLSGEGLCTHPGRTPDSCSSGRLPPGDLRGPVRAPVHGLGAGAECVCGPLGQHGSRRPERVCERELLRGFEGPILPPLRVT